MTNSLIRMASTIDICIEIGHIRSNVVVDDDINVKIHVCIQAIKRNSLIEMEVQNLTNLKY